MTPPEIGKPPVQPPTVGTVALPVDPAQPPDRLSRADLTQITLAVLFMIGLAAAALWVLWPFTPAILWATMIVVALWPVMLRVQARLRSKRWAAVTIMTIGLMLALVLPLSLAVMTVVSHAEDVGAWSQTLREARLPSPPAWIERVPVAGPRAFQSWSEASAAGPAELAQRLEPHLRSAAQWLLTQLGNVGLLVVVQFLLTLVIAAILFASGEGALAGVLGFFRRLAGAHGENGVILAGNAIRSVALGVMVTALVQSVLGGIGFAIAGIPFAGALTALMFVLSIAQIGPIPVLLGAVIWMYSTSDSAWGPTALLVWCILVGAIDNILRPILIRASGDLPLIIIFAGVIGGLLGFGLIGLFVGPVVLAVVYTLLKAWVAADAPGDSAVPLRPRASP